jgi:hypothetical protein
MRVEATALVDEALDLADKIVPVLSGSSAIIEFASLARALGRERPLLALLETAPELPWVVAGRALASGDPERAAHLLAQIGCPPAEAYARLRTAEDLVDGGRAADAEPHVEAALRFYRSVGATRFVDKAESIRARSPDRDSASTRHASSQ